MIQGGSQIDGVFAEIVILFLLSVCAVALVKVDIAILVLYVSFPFRLFRFSLLVLRAASERVAFKAFFVALPKRFVRVDALVVVIVVYVTHLPSVALRVASFIEALVTGPSLASLRPIVLVLVFFVFFVVVIARALAIECRVEFA